MPNNNIHVLANFQNHTVQLHLEASFLLLCSMVYLTQMLQQHSRSKKNMKKFPVIHPPFFFIVYLNKSTCFPDIQGDLFLEFNQKQSQIVLFRP